MLVQIEDYELNAETERSNAWYAVHGALNRYCPKEFMESNKSGKDRAVDAIFDMARRIEEQEQTIKTLLRLKNV